MEWRLILDGDLPGQINMARDTAVLKALDEGRGVPTLRLYGWERPTISIGHAQDAAPFLESGLPVVRRTTGGRAVVHWREVTYSVTGLCDDPLFSGGILGAYSVISGCITAALKDAGVDAALFRGSAGAGKSAACFQTPSRFEVLADGRKLVGSAQRRFRKAFLQHGSILMSSEPELNEAVFGRKLTSQMASVGEFSGVSVQGLRGLLVKSFSEGLGAAFVLTGLREGEEALLEGLAPACLVSKGEADEAGHYGIIQSDCFS
ncbi:MAG TPA: biotin/lipoate A/B protein ligase family protein [Thermodesulfobacteriota bacterium]